MPWSKSKPPPHPSSSGSNREQREPRKSLLGSLFIPVPKYYYIPTINWHLHSPKRSRSRHDLQAPGGPFPSAVEGGMGMGTGPQQDTKQSSSPFAELGLKRRKSSGRDRETAIASTRDGERDRSRLSGLVGISSNDVLLHGLPSYHPHPHPHHPVPSSPSPIASSSGHFSSSGISSSSSSVTQHHGSIINTSLSSSSSSSALGHTTLGIIPSVGTSTSAVRQNRPSNATASSSSASRLMVEKSSPKLSSANRTMADGLARMKAREAQFLVKGIGHVVPGGGKSRGKRYHPHPRELVPYPRSYEREVVDLDIWETQFCLDICNSLTWHVFETPPKKVLDLGCGSGTWILQCAKVWKDCHFVGLDVVPLHPDLEIIGSPDTSRITWVQHNFLESLPFENEEFDFVHAKRLALGVPENKWDSLFDEIRRVLKPGGALELIEEDLFFPGTKQDGSEGEETDSVTVAGDKDDSTLATRRNSISSDQHSMDKHSEIETPETPTSAHHTALAGPYSNSSYASSSSTSANIITPHSRSTARPSLSLKTLKGSSRTPHSDMGASQSIFGSNVGILGGMGYMASEDPVLAFIKEQKMQRAAAAAPPPPPLPSQPTLSKSRVDPSGRSNLKMVTDPRDHTMLEAIWNGMLDTRFINRTPLSVLATYLDNIFVDVRTHPPLVYTFPETHPTEYWDSDPDEDSDSDSDAEDDAERPTTQSQPESDPDEARDAIVPRPQSIKSAQSQSSATQQREWQVFDPDSPWDDLYRRLAICYPYITLDGSRVWSKNSSHSGASLPNTTLRIDLKCLNQHLALRAKEIIACSESMWEWVLERQSNADKDAAQGSRNRSGSASIETYMVGVPSSTGDSSLDLTQNAILEMTRDDFNHLMNNFHLDMEDKASLGHANQERFGWNVFKSQITQDRKAFNKACKKYDKWVAKTTRRAKRVATNPYRQTINHQARNSMSASAPGLVLPASELAVPHDYNLIARSTSTPQPTSDRRVDDTASVVTAVNIRQDLTSAQAYPPVPPVLPTFSLSQLPPEKRQSRAIRVFVAWKAS